MNLLMKYGLAKRFTMNLLMKYVLLHVTLKKKTTVQFVETVEMEERVWSSYREMARSKTQWI